MRVALESHELLISRMSGVGRYVFELGRHLQQIEPGARFSLPLSRIGKHLRLWRNGVHGMRYVLPSWCPQRKCDILHLTAGKSMRVAGRPVVILTVHDLWEFIEIARGERVGHSNANKRLMALLARADGTICISRSTQEDLKRFFPQMTTPSAVIHHGVSDMFARSSSSVIADVRARVLPQIGEYLLYVGHFHPRKNIPGLIAGYAALTGTRPALVLAGNHDPVLRAQMAAHARFCGVGEHELIQLDYVADQDLAPLLSGARGVVFVPLYEGFGLPLIEAYRCGTPVVCANNSSLPELVHPSTPLVNAEDPADVARGIRALLDAHVDDRLREALMAHGRTFSWERCARETHAFYQQVLAMRAGA